MTEFRFLPEYGEGLGTAHSLRDETAARLYVPLYMVQQSLLCTASTSYGPTRIAAAKRDPPCQTYAWSSEHSHGHLRPLPMAV